MDWDRFREIQLLRESGRPTEALAEFEALRRKGLNDEENSSVLLHEALCYCDLRIFDKAENAASKAVLLLPFESNTRPFAEFSLACVHERAGKLELAAKGLRALLEEHKEVLRTADFSWLRLGVQQRLVAILIALGLATEPLSLIGELKKEDLTSEERADVLYREGMANEILGRHRQALECYRQALAGSLELGLTARAHFRIGEMLFRRGEYERALDEFSNAKDMTQADSPDKLVIEGWLNATLLALNGQS